MIVEPFRTARDGERCFEPASSQPSESVPLRKSRPNLAVGVVAECADAFRSSYWTLRDRGSLRVQTATIDRDRLTCERGSRHQGTVTTDTISSDRDHHPSS